MLEYFVRNRRGSITVMLSIILIAALSLNSTLIELAKYHSMERLYKEMGENAAFSLLSYYDRDLYKNFGFLALEHGVGEEELKRYLQMNLEGLESGLQLNRADILADDVSVDVARLYPLSQKDVYVAQMMEFSAYRAPTSLVNNALNIEDMLNQLKKELEKALPVLKAFQSLTNITEKYVNMVICSYEYYEAEEKLEKAANNYIEKLNSYNAAISAIDDFISSYDDESEESNNGSDWSADSGQTGSGKVKDETYDSQLKALQNIAAENAAELQKCIVELDPILEDYGKKMQAFIDAYDEALGAAMTEILDGIKQDMTDLGKELDSAEDKSIVASAGNFIDKMKKNVNDGQGVFDTLNSYIKKIPASQIEDARRNLEEQLNKLSVPAEALVQLEAVKEVDPAGNVLLLFVIEWIGFVDTMAKMVEGLIEAIGTIIKGVTAMSLAFSGCPYDPFMNHTINNNVAVLTSTVNNPYAAMDKNAVEAKLNDSKEIAQSVGYNVDLLAPGASWEASALETAMNNLVAAEGRFREACGNLHIADPITMLNSLIELAGAVMNFIAKIIEIIDVFLHLSIETLMQVIYQKLFTAVYATEMFSNRVTDLQSDKRLNGSKFFTEWDYANSKACFVKADAEYIYRGQSSEIVNQTGAFNSILMFRMLCNITSVLTDEKLMELLEGLLEIPILGWIAAVVIILVKLLLEAWFDMIQMIYAKKDVDIFKLDGGYFSLDGEGLDKLEEMVKAAIKEQTTIEIKTNDEKKTEDKSKIDEYGEGLLKWGYKDHLFLMILLFTSRDKIYQRSATLIETQLQQKKAKDGADYSFRLNDMATYIRVDTVAEYRPLLPIPVVPGLNDTGIKIRTVQYSGY